MGIPMLSYSQARAERLTTKHQTSGGGTMTISEIMALLTLLAVVIFGIIEIMKKK